MKLYSKYASEKLFPAMKKAAILLSLLAIFSSCTKDEATSEPPLTNATAPAFTLSALSGSQVKLSDYTNKVVVLFFFGNTCPSCTAAGPGVQSMLAAPFASRTDYQILGLDQWNGNSASVQAFKTATGVTFPLLLDASAVAASYKTTYDRIVVIDKTGKIVFSGTQGVAGDIATVKALVETLLGPPPVISGNAPEFALKNLSGSTIKLSDYSNKVVVLFFFGNTCPSCIAAAPSVTSMLHTPFASRNDYQILGLDQWNGNMASVESFMTKTGATFPLLLNASAVASSYKTTYDRLVVIDKSGNIVFTGSQGAASDIATVKEKVKMLLGI